MTTVRIVAALNAASPVPLYYQLAEQVSREALAGRYPVGSRLEPEPRIAHHLGVSRHTVRQAMDLLERRQIISRTKGFPHTVIWSASPIVTNSNAAPKPPAPLDQPGSADAPAASGGPSDRHAGAWRPLEIYVPARLSTDETTAYVHDAVRSAASDAGEFVAEVGELRTTDPTAAPWRKYSTFYRPGPPSTFPESPG